MSTLFSMLNDYEGVHVGLFKLILLLPNCHGPITRSSGLDGMKGLIDTIHVRLQLKCSYTFINLKLVSAFHVFFQLYCRLYTHFAKYWDFV